MKNHLGSCLVIGLLILSGATSLASPAPTQTMLRLDSAAFPAPTAAVINGETTLAIQGCDQTTGIPGEPLLPVQRRTYEFPLGTTITTIQVTPEATFTAALPAPVTMTPRPQIDTLTTTPSIAPSPVYTQDQPYPMAWYSSQLTGGLNSQDQPTAFLTLELHPVRYNPVQQTLLYATSFSIDIHYTPSSSPRTLANETRFVIITTDSYKNLLTPLMDHKMAHGISTKIVTISDITKGTYFPATGRDTAEKMKYFIKAAHEQWGTLYVMLVGNYKQVPTRDVWIETDVGLEYQELNFACDLYFADLYNGTGGFSSWDTNNNGVYGEWLYPEGHAAVDAMDFVPDVHLARLACMTKAEVRTQVNKIITYETTAKNASWFSRIVVAGGDTFPNEGGTDYNEGEVTTQYALNMMPQFTAIKLWVSLGNISTENITAQLDQGAGFAYLCGHGNPKNWGTHFHDDTNWTAGFNNKDIKQLSNTNKCPVLMVGGCHNSEIDVTPMNFITGLLKEGLNYFKVNKTWLGEYFLYDYVPECWSWVFVRGSGGAIASMGSCGFGCDGDGDYNHDGIPDCAQEYDGWFEINFFRLYGQDNVSILGHTYDQDVTQYCQNFPVLTSRYDAKDMATHIIIGDPTLQIGGY